MDKFLSEHVTNKAELDAHIATLMIPHANILCTDEATKAFKAVLVQKIYQRMCEQAPKNFIYGNDSWPLVVSTQKQEHGCLIPWKLPEKKEKEASRLIRQLYEHFMGDSTDFAREIYSNNWSWLHEQNISLIVTAASKLSPGNFRALYKGGILAKFCHVTSRSDKFRNDLLEALSVNVMDSSPTNKTQAALSPQQKQDMAFQTNTFFNTALSYLQEGFEIEWKQKKKIEAVQTSLFAEFQFGLPTYNNGKYEGIQLRRDHIDLQFRSPSLEITKAKYIDIQGEQVFIVLNSNSKTNTDGSATPKRFELDPNCRLSKLLKLWRPLALQLSKANYVFAMFSSKKKWGQKFKSTSFYQNFGNKLGLKPGQMGVGCARKTNAQNTIAEVEKDISVAGGITTEIASKKRKAAATSLHSTATHDNYAAKSPKKLAAAEADSEVAMALDD
jgi:hypothetical protein